MWKPFITPSNTRKSHINVVNHDVDVIFYQHYCYYLCTVSQHGVWKIPICRINEEGSGSHSLCILNDEPAHANYKYNPRHKGIYEGYLKTWPRAWLQYQYSAENGRSLFPGQPGLQDETLPPKSKIKFKELLLQCLDSMVLYGDCGKFKSSPECQPTSRHLIKGKPWIWSTYFCRVELHLIWFLKPLNICKIVH